MGERRGRVGNGPGGRRWRTLAVAATLVATLATVAAACTAAPVPVEFSEGAGDVVGVEAPATAAPIEFRGSDLVDAEGRVVQIHGINMVRKSAPFHVSPDEADFAANLERVRRSGFNGVRLGVWMAELMPEPGVVDTEYLAEVERGVDALAAEGLWVLLDFHQDVFTGMPDWATTPETAALSPTLPGGDAFWALAYFAPRSMQQWEDLYDRVPVADGRSAVDLMGDAVAAVAERFQGDPNVIGIDLMNEPWPGERFFDCLAGGCGARYVQLQSIYEEYTAKARAAAPGMRVWWAPYNFGTPFQQAPAPSGPDVALTYHSYCLYTDGGEPVQPGAVENALCRSVYEGQTAEALQLGRAWDTPVLLGEFGASASPLNTTRLTELADEQQMSWMYWDDNYYRGAPEAVRTDLVRTYPQATAGDIVRQRFVPATGAFDLRYVPDHSVSAPTAIVAPTEVYPDGYSVTVTGGSVTSAPNAGRITVVADPGATEVTVRVTRV
jgi:endoglycosylceramidase